MDKQVGSAEAPVHRVVSVIRLSPVNLAVLHDRWSELARSLELQEYEISKIRQDLILSKIALTDALIEIITKWVGIRGSDAKVSRLVETLMHWSYDFVQSFLLMSLPVWIMEGGNCRIDLSKTTFQRDEIGSCTYST